ncbi:hypothetical protein [Vibrio agarivorans]|uniref:Uncharacterized protein n=1 Tax=Vibrio agarivorans TaxID=153622 RepID=A0ABT7Y3H2_9VIBR|nr:hypothetical protein [Vibrio agarivorans]MDN2482591.1 hypothetical protein [Vibrio agarivorans]
MAVKSPHISPRPHYDKSGDMTLEQWHRYTRVANTADKIRESEQAHQRASLSSSKPSKQVPQDHEQHSELVKRLALSSILHSKKHKAENIRYAIWMSVGGLFFLWVMYMFG